MRGAAVVCRSRVPLGLCALLCRVLTAGCPADSMKHDYKVLSIDVVVGRCRSGPERSTIGRACMHGRRMRGSIVE